MQNAANFTCSCNLVKGSVWLVRGVSWDVIAEADGSEGDEAVVEWVEIVPVRFEGGEGGSGHQHEGGHQECGHQHQVHQTDVEGLVEVAQAGVEELQQHRGRHHQPLHQRRQQHQRQRNPQHGVQHTKHLASFRQWGHVPVPCNKFRINRSWGTSIST